MRNNIGGQIKKIVQESIKVKEKTLRDEKLLAAIKKAVILIFKTFKNNKKILIFGNGGSAADAQHFAAEMVNRFKVKRKPLLAISLVTDTSILSSIANDSGYDYVFSKQIEALGERGDIALALTTSDVEAKEGGHSVNIANGLIAARKKGLITIGLVSEKSRKILKLLDLAIKIPSKNTPRIQEAHIMVLHIICEIVENSLFKNKR